MKRRTFIKAGLLFVPFVPNILVRGQGLSLRNPSFVGAVLKPAATGGGGSGLDVTDNFDSYTNAATLESQTNWSLILKTGYLVINKPSSDGSVACSSNGYYCSCARTDAFTANHRAEITIDAWAAGKGTYFGPAVRCQTSPATRYYHAVVAPNDANVYLEMITGESSYVSITSAAWTGDVGYKLAIQASGSGSSTRVSVEVNTGGGWSSLLSNIDPGVGNYLDNGKPGISNYTSSSDTGTRIDDFRGVDL